VSFRTRLFSARALPTILIVAALLRFGFSVWVVGLHAMTRGDEADYHAIAMHVVEGRGFAAIEDAPTARRPPAYPAFLSLVYRVTGPDPAAGRVAQIVLGVALVWLTMRVARAWFGNSAQTWAGWLAALNPFLIFLSGYLLTENLYLVFMLAALLSAPTPASLCRAPLVRVSTMAILLGLATLARPSGLPMLEWILAAMLLFGAVPWKERIVRAGVAAAVFALVLTPWLVRNARVMGAPVLTTHGGITFYQGNNEKVATTPQWHGGVAPLEALPGYDRIKGMNEIERDREAWKLGREYLIAHPGKVPALVFWKLARCWRLRSDMGLSGIRSGWWFDNRSWPGKLASRLDVGMVYAVVALPLFLAGLWITRRRRRDLLFAYGVVVVHTAVAVIFFGSLRTRIPVEPMICIFAAATIVSVRTAHGAARPALPRSAGS